MTHTKTPAPNLPHHNLHAYRLALELVKLLAGIRIAGAQLRAQARKSAASCALNTAEGAARRTLPDKSRAYSTALCEACEACAALEIAGGLGVSSPSDVHAVLTLTVRIKNVLTRLIR